MYRSDRATDKFSSTELRKFCAQLLMAQKTGRAVLDSLAMQIIGFDLEGTIVLQNNVSIGFSLLPPQSQGKQIWAVLHDKQLAEKIRHNLSRSMDVDEVVKVDSDSGTYGKYIRCKSFPMVDQKKIIGTILQVTDCTEELKTIDQTIGKERISSYEAISRGIAHEIRNPLSGMGLYLHLLKKGIGDIQDLETTRKKNLEKYIGIIEEELLAMDEIVSLFLHNMRKEEVVFEPCNLNDIVRSFMNFVQVELEQKNIVSQLSLSKKPVIALVSPSAVRHVLLNLTKNAMEAMDERGELIISTHFLGSTVQIHVTDTGSGIDPNDAKEIFNPYFSTKDAGTGLGLAIVERIMFAHKGSVLLDANRQIGTRFILNFPSYAKFWLPKE